MRIHHRDDRAFACRRWHPLRIVCLIPLMSAVFAQEWLVGPGRANTTPSSVASDPALQAGDVISIDAGTYQDVCIWPANRDGLTLRGVGGIVRLDATGLALAGGKAIWVIAGDACTVDGIEFSGAACGDRNGAGVRSEGAGLTVRNCRFHDNENGILAGAHAGSDIVVEQCEFADNGHGDGYSHNLYIGAVRSLVFRGNYSHHARIGHNLKTRALANYIMANRIMDEAGGTSSYAIDVPQGGLTYIVGNLIQKGPHTDNLDALVTYAEESVLGAAWHASQHLYVINNTIVNDCAPADSGNILFVRVNSSAASPGTVARIENNIFLGPGTAIGTYLFNGTYYSGSQASIAAVNNLRVLDHESCPLVGRSTYDYRLVAGASAIDAALDPGSDADQGLVLLPAIQYLHPAGWQTRTTRGAAPDAGAYESPDHPPEVPAGAGASNSGSDGGGGCGAGVLGGLLLAMCAALGLRRGRPPRGALDAPVAAHLVAPHAADSTPGVRMSHPLRSALLVLVCHLAMAAAEPVFRPWVPQQLDDWDALQAEAKAHVDYLERQFPVLPAIRAQHGIGMMDLNTMEPGPPKGTLASDCIAISYAVEHGKWRVVSGYTIVWRAAGGGAAGAHVVLPLAEPAKVMPTVIPDASAAAQQLHAWAATMKPPAGTWEVGGRAPAYWQASWLRPGGRAVTRDDSEGRAPDLRPEDVRWLTGPPAPAALQPVKPLDARAYAAAQAAHPAVEAAWARYRAGWAPRTVTVFALRSEVAGIQAGDTVIGVDGRPVYSWRAVDGLSVDAPHRIALTRLGEQPRMVDLPAGRRVLQTIDGPPEPAMAVLAACGAVPQTVVGDVLVAMCAPDQPELVATAIRRLTTTLKPPALTFVQAWAASARDDFGRADALLAGCKTDHVALAFEVEQLRASNRERSGRFYWAWPERAEEQTHRVLRHLMRGLAADERFPVYTGNIDVARLPRDAAELLQPLDEGVGMLAGSGGRLAASGERRFAQATFADLPDRVLLSTRFTWAAASTATRRDPDAGLRIGFQRRSRRLISGEDCGACAVAADGRVYARPATLDERYTFAPWQALPVAIRADGATLHTLRVVRIGSLQRIEVNGHAVVQGFLPLTMDAQERYAINLEVGREVVAEFSDMRWSTTAEPGKPSDF